MYIRNTTKYYGLPAIALHWLMAILILVLFPLGLFMTSLDYYHPWYHSAPWWHKSFGLLTFLLLLVRAGWRLSQQQPAPLATLSVAEVRIAAVVHRLFYLLLLLLCLSGYLISTAQGRGIEFFGWFEAPAFISGIKGQEDIAGAAHLALAISLISLVAVHMAAALKHHFYNGDATLRRMLGEKK